MTPFAKRLNIPDDYFADEERDGFLIPEQMKRAWAAKMQLLSWIGEICDRYGLRWWADWGTLIGAARHRGFIPWDDDIDISMPRSDFESVIPLLRAELPVQCEVCRYDDVNITSCVYVMNRKRTDMGDDEGERALTDFYFGCPYRCAIDIFPLDYIPVDKTETDDWHYLGEAVYCVACEYENQMRSGILEDQLQLIEEITRQQLPRGEGCRSALLKLFDQISQMYTIDESESMACYAVWLLNRKERPLSLYEKTVRLPFEMIDIPMPAGYQQVLEGAFGNWCVPVKGTTTHGYPFYEEEEAMIAAHQAQRSEIV